MQTSAAKGASHLYAGKIKYSHQAENEMRGAFCKNVENGGGCFFVKKVENGGVLRTF